MLYIYSPIPKNLSKRRDTIVKGPTKAALWLFAWPISTKNSGNFLTLLFMLKMIPMVEECTLKPSEPRVS